MAVIHISETEAIRDMADVLAKVKKGERVNIEEEGRTVAMITPPSAPAKTGNLREILRSLGEEESRLTLDDKFGDDMEAIIARRHIGYPRDPEI